MFTYKRTQNVTALECIDTFFWDRRIRAAQMRITRYPSLKTVELMPVPSRARVRAYPYPCARVHVYPYPCVRVRAYPYLNVSPRLDCRQSSLSYCKPSRVHVYVYPRFRVHVYTRSRICRSRCTFTWYLNMISKRARTFMCHLDFAMDRSRIPVDSSSC